MKKYLILLSSIFIFLIGINKVNASVGGTTLQYSQYTITYEEQVTAGCWYKWGVIQGDYSTSDYRDYYLCSSNKSIIAWKPSGALHLLDNLNVVDFSANNNFKYENVFLWSSYNNQYTLILSEGDLPTLGGTCTNDSYCFNIINSGYQGNGRSATANSNTILYTFIDSNYRKYFTSGTYFGTQNPSINIPNGSSCNTTYSLIYSTQSVYNQSNIALSCGFHLSELQNPEPEYDYEVMKGSEKGQRVLFEFDNFYENSYILVRDLSSGTEYRQDDLLNNTQFDIDNISYDSIFYFEIYNYDYEWNEYDLIGSGTINIYSDFLATGQPIIKIELDKNNLIATLGYYEIDEDYQLYYAINGDNFINIENNPENLEIVHLDNDRLVNFPNTGVRENNNYVLRGRITDSNGRILYDIGYNVVFFPDKPYFSFISSYNSSTGANEVEITLHNFQNNDIVYYSYDNINFTQFDNINVNKLEVYSDTDIYTKVVRGNNTYYGFYHVNLNGYNNSSNSIYDNTNGYDDNLFTGFKNLFTGVDMSFLNNISTFFNALKGSYVFRFVMLCITGALILFIMRMIRR